MGTGKGRVVDVNLVDSVFSLMEGMLPEYALDGRVRQPAGAAIADRLADQHLPLRRWAVAVHRRELRPDLLPADGGDRPAGDGGRSGLCDQRAALRRTATPLDAAIAAWTRTLPAKDAEAMLEDAEVPCSRLFDIADCAADPHFRARQAVQDVRRSADRAHAASRADDPAGWRTAGGCGALDRSGGRRAHRPCAAHAAGACQEIKIDPAVWRWRDGVALAGAGCAALHRPGGHADRAIPKHFGISGSR